MIPQNSFLEKQLTDFFPLSSQKINDVAFLFPVTLGYLCMKMDFFQIKVSTSLSDGKGICRAMCTLHIHASLNFLITFEMYNIFKWEYAVWLLIDEMRVCGQARASVSLSVVVSSSWPSSPLSSFTHCRPRPSPVGQRGLVTAQMVTLCASSSPCNACCAFS